MHRWLFKSAYILSEQIVLNTVVLINNIILMNKENMMKRLINYVNSAIELEIDEQDFEFEMDDATEL